MKKHKNWVRGFNDLALSVLLVLGIALVITVFIRNSPQPAQIIETQPYPLPDSEEATLAPRGTVIFVEESAPETPIYGEAGKPGEAYPQPPPYPTFTPFPSPTLRPGPTATAIPLPKIGADTAGDIRYFFVQDSRISVESLAIDSAGALKGAPVQIASVAYDDISGKRLFPSPDRRFLSIVGDWGTGVIFDALNGKVYPISKNIVPEDFFNWYPDNRHVLIQASLESLWLVDTISGEYFPLAVPGLGKVDAAAASPDGRSVIYSHYYKNNTQLRIVDADGRNDRLILELPSRVGSIAWSPDNQKIAFRSAVWTVLDLKDIGTVNLDSFNVIYCHFFTPTWSPDSRTLAFVISNNTSPCRDFDSGFIEDSDILLFDVQTGERKTIRPNGEKGNANPIWSPDGSHLAFLSIQSGRPEIWIRNNDDGSLRQITNQGIFLYLLSWQKPE
jgi:hypothetical protein